MFPNTSGKPRPFTLICLGGIVLLCAAAFLFALYLQHRQGLEPCPLCILQRYAVLWVGLVSVFALVVSRWYWAYLAALCLALLGTVAGAGVAARQSWLQWFPPEYASCGRDFYSLTQTFPLSRAIPMIFQGSGDCTRVDGAWLGGSLANWSFVGFVGLGLALLWVLWSAVCQKPLNQQSR